MGVLPLRRNEVTNPVRVENVGALDTAGRDALQSLTMDFGARVLTRTVEPHVERWAGCGSRWMSLAPVPEGAHAPRLIRCTG
jgi:hypothetical protein